MRKDPLFRFEMVNIFTGQNIVDTRKKQTYRRVVTPAYIEKAIMYV